MGILGRSNTLYNKKSLPSFNSWKCMVEAIGVETMWEGCFPSKHQLINEMLPALVTKTMGNFVNLVLIDYITCMVAFDLWMSQGDNDTFALVISVINALWQTWMWQLGLFIVESTMGTAMAKQMKDLLRSFGLSNKVITFVKDKRTNLGIMTIALKSKLSFVTCWIFQLHLLELVRAMLCQKQPNMPQMTIKFMGS